MSTAYLALGANLGDRQRNIVEALARLERRGACRVQQLSYFHETAPVGCPSGAPRFVNAVARAETTLSARRLMAELLAVERELGRERSADAPRGAPRTIDLDLLLYDEFVCDLPAGRGPDEPALTLPHPRMRERPFVMIPLAEVAPGELVARLRGQNGPPRN